MKQKSQKSPPKDAAKAKMPTKCYASGGMVKSSKGSSRGMGAAKKGGSYKGCY